MEDSEGVLSFDFEGGLDVAPTIPTASIPSIQHHDSAATVSAHISVANPADTATANNGSGRRSFRQTVCRHWLRSLCMKGDACGFLHQYDKARMPICRFFRLYGECREQDCVYKHTNEDIKECNMYKLGFCPNGSDCRYRHAKLPGPPPSVEEVLQKIQALTSFNSGTSNRFFQQRNSGYTQHVEKSQFPQGLNSVNQDVPVNPSMVDSATIQHQITQSQQQPGQTQMPNLPNGAQNQISRISTPLPQGVSRYFIVKSCNRENFELSIQQGVWATQRSNEAKLNEAFDSVENVILVFSVNRTRHFQGCAKMTSKIGGFVGGGNWKYEHGTAHYGRNFSVKWLKLCELSFHKTRLLKNPYNENLPVKISRDCQELEPSIGEELASLLYLEPDSELMEVSVAAELKREEEKEKGVNPDNGSENPDIVPFQDNEEEEEEEEESEEDEEDESFGQGFGTGMQGRGRGRGVMWPPSMPMGRGAGPIPGMMRFPPVMMGPEGFPIPDLFGVGPRGFPPFGPRFPGDFPAPPPGMMFHGRPPQPGFGMMMGPGHAPFIGGPGRGGRPAGMHAMFPPPPQSLPSTQNSNWVGKRDQRAQGNDRNTRDSSGAEQGRGQSDGPEDERQYHNHGSKAQEDESGSEDEAPRRSRHGEGKKRRRDSEGDATTAS